VYCFYDTGTISKLSNDLVPVQPLQDVTEPILFMGFEAGCIGTAYGRPIRQSPPSNRKGKQHANSGSY
jgi:hypothetical protein